MRPNPRPRWTVLIALPMAGALALASTAPLSAYEEPAGATPAVLGGPVAAPKSAKITFYLVLKRKEHNARQALRAISDPTSSRYRHFLTRSKIRRAYGAKLNPISVVVKSAMKSDLTATLDYTGLFMRISGTVGSMEKWIHGTVTVDKRSLEPNRQTLQKVWEYTAGTGHLPSKVKKVSTGFLPIYVVIKTFSVMNSLAHRPFKPVQGNRGTYIGGCGPAQEINTYSFAQLARAYGTDKLSHTAATGQASRMAIIASGSGYSDESLTQSAGCFATTGRYFIRQSVDGVVGSLPEGVEGDLDTQVAQAVMPVGSLVTVIESGGPSTWFLPWAKAFALPQLPDAVSMSYGICEAAARDEGLTQQMIKLIDSTLVRLGLAGTTASASAGDDGSSGCMETLNTRDRAVQYPASSPFINAVGGSRLVLFKDNTRRNEVVWHDVKRTMVVNGDVVPAPKSGGGGGASILFGKPWWQKGSHTGSHQRTVPDIAMHASFGPGWPVFLTKPAARANKLAGAGFYAIAGTSAASPYFSSNLAVLAAMARQKHRPAFGHVTPMLYRMARKQPGSLYDIFDGTNDLYSQGCCTADFGYDQASGWGVPKFNVFPARIPAPGK